MEGKATLILGASIKPERYANRAIKSLRQHGHTVYAIGSKEGLVENVIINIGFPEFKNVDTVTLYLSAKNQFQYYNYIFKLNPKRIIFNPGAENKEFYEMATDKKIECLEACTLVMLATGQY